MLDLRYCRGGYYDKLESTFHLLVPLRLQNKDHLFLENKGHQLAGKLQQVVGVQYYVINLPFREKSIFIR